MSNPRFQLCLLVALAIFLAGSALFFHSTSDVQAKPLAGFTPTPTPRSHHGGGGGNDSHDTSPPSNDEPKDYLWVQLNRCDLQCSAGTAHTDGQPDFQLVAQPATFPEMLVPVRLVHDGSGFITEAELSDVKPARFPVPYPGRWTVWLTGNPRFVTAGAVDVTGSNMASLQAQLAAGPVALGVVETNTTEPQWIRCPLACVVEVPPVAEYLPQTGSEKPNRPWPALALLASSALILIGLILRAIVQNRSYPS